MNEPISLRHTIVPKSDQLNADELLAGPMTITVTGVTVNNSPDQPVSVHYQGDNGKPYKPCKSMRKVMIFAWGDDGRAWVGRRATLYNDPEIKFGGIKVGGIRISHLSGINSDIAISITETKGKKKPVTIRKLPDAPINATPGVDPVALQAAADTLTKAATRGVEALKIAGGSIDQTLIAPLKDHYNSLKPIAIAADQAKLSPEIRGFNAAEPEQPAPADQPQQQSPAAGVEQGEKEEF